MLIKLDTGIACDFCTVINACIEVANISERKFTLLLIVVELRLYIVVVADGVVSVAEIGVVENVDGIVVLRQA